MVGNMDIELTRKDRVGCVVFKTPCISEISETSSGRDILNFIEKEKPEKFIFDFKEVKFFSSQVLGLLLEARAKLEKYNGCVIISGINPQLYRVFRITHLDKIFTFYPDKESAINAEVQ